MSLYNKQFVKKTITLIQLIMTKMLHQSYHLLRTMTTKARLATKGEKKLLQQSWRTYSYQRIRKQNLQWLTTSRYYSKRHSPMRTCDAATGTSCLLLYFSCTTILLQYNLHHCIHHTIINITGSAHDDWSVQTALGHRPTDFRQIPVVGSRCGHTFQLSVLLRQPSRVGMCPI